MTFVFQPNENFFEKKALNEAEQLCLNAHSVEDLIKRWLTPERDASCAPDEAPHTDTIFVLLRERGEEVGAVEISFADFPNFRAIDPVSKAYLAEAQSSDPFRRQDDEWFRKRDHQLNGVFDYASQTVRLDWSAAVEVAVSYAKSRNGFALFSILDETQFELEEDADPAQTSSISLSCMFNHESTGSGWGEYFSIADAQLSHTLIENEHGRVSP